MIWNEWMCEWINEEGPCLCFSYSIGHSQPLRHQMILGWNEKAWGRVSNLNTGLDFSLHCSSYRSQFSQSIITAVPYGILPTLIICFCADPFINIKCSVSLFFLKCSFYSICTLLIHMFYRPIRNWFFRLWFYLLLSKFSLFGIIINQYYFRKFTEWVCFSVHFEVCIVFLFSHVITIRHWITISLLWFYLLLLSK